MKSFLSCPDPAYLTPSTMNVRSAPGRSREDVRNAILFRQRAAERSAAHLARVEAMIKEADQRHKLRQQTYSRNHDGRGLPLLWLAPMTPPGPIRR